MQPRAGAQLYRGNDIRAFELDQRNPNFMDCHAFRIAVAAIRLAGAAGVSARAPRISGLPEEPFLLAFLARSQHCVREAIECRRQRPSAPGLRGAPVGRTASPVAGCAVPRPRRGPRRAGARKGRGRRWRGPRRRGRAGCRVYGACPDRRGAPTGRGAPATPRARRLVRGFRITASCVFASARNASRPASVYALMRWRQSRMCLRKTSGSRLTGAWPPGECGRAGMG